MTSFRLDSRVGTGHGSVQAQEENDPELLPARHKPDVQNLMANITYH